MTRWRQAALAVLLAWAVTATAGGLPLDWTPLDAAVRGQIAAGRLPGAVAVIGDADHIWLRRAWGRRAVLPQAEAMTADTVFDLASLTKVICTTTAVLQLAEAHRLQLDAPVARYWPAFGAHGKAGITVAQLLSHSSGLGAGWVLSNDDDAASITRRLLAETPREAPGSRLVYSDIGFVALGLLVQRVSGLPLDRYCARHVFQPLGLRDTGFRPAAALRPRIAPTELRDGAWLRGQVQDPTARRMAGVAGNAGLFGSADDLARFAQAVLRGGRRSPLSARSLAAMRQPQGALGGPVWHGLGWQVQAPLVAEREAQPPQGAVGHTGYTGTGLWIDFVQRRFVVLLASRLHPALQSAAAGDLGPDARPLRRQVLALVASLAPALPADSQSACGACPSPDPDTPPVRSGIDVLRDSGYAALAGRRVGLVTQLAAVDRHGWRTLDRLRRAPGVTLLKVFTPEHGLFGDAEGRIDSGTEPFSGLPLLSLYGAHRRPTPDMLAGLDTLVVDLQDAGARFFTYLSTLGAVMEAAGEAGLRVVVLDRPNPLGADAVRGPLLDAERRSFTAYAVLPVQHGMTLGELARFVQAGLLRERGLAVDLQVIAMQGYRRGMRFEQTGLDWTPPSPNLRRPGTALVYPGAAWLEGANVSVGRGTERPFEWLGAPWIDGPRWAEALNRLGLPGVSFQPTAFVPRAAPFAGEHCEGIALKVTDRERFDAPLMGAALVQTLYALWPADFAVDRTLGIIGSAQTLERLRRGDDLAAIQAGWQAERAAFEPLRRAALLYPAAADEKRIEEPQR